MWAWLVDSRECSVGKINPLANHLFHCLPFLMYALKARDKLHKKEKDEYEARHHPKNPKRKSGANFKPAKDSPSVTVNREAKVNRSCS